MPYNPCGAIVDWGRHRYDTKCRFFDDNDIEITIRWYPALPSARCLDWPHAIYQTVWDDDNYSQPVLDQVGEVYDSPHVTSHMRAVPGADGSHVCGDQDAFENGVHYDPDIFVPYRLDGLPTCCPGTVPKGILWGGEPLPPPQGGMLWGGTAIQAIANTVPSCPVPGAAHIGPSGIPTAVRLGPAYPTDQTMFFIVVDAGATGTFRVNYSGGQAGTVFLFRIVHPSFCIFSDTIYSGPADVPFEQDVMGASNRDICISVFTSPEHTEQVIVTVTALP